MIKYFLIICLLLIFFLYTPVFSQNTLTFPQNREKKSPQFTYTTTTIRLKKKQSSKTESAEKLPKNLTVKQWGKIDSDIRAKLLTTYYDIVKENGKTTGYKIKKEKENTVKDNIDAEIWEAVSKVTIKKEVEQITKLEFPDNIPIEDYNRLNNIDRKVLSNYYVLDSSNKKYVLKDSVKKLDNKKKINALKQINIAMRKLVALKMPKKIDMDKVNNLDEDSKELIKKYYKVDGNRNDKKVESEDKDLLRSVVGDLESKIVTKKSLAFTSGVRLAYFKHADSSNSITNVPLYFIGVDYVGGFGQSFMISTGFQILRVTAETEESSTVSLNKVKEADGFSVYFDFRWFFSDLIDGTDFGEIRGYIKAMVNSTWIPNDSIKDKIVWSSFLGVGLHIPFDNKENYGFFLEIGWGTNSIFKSEDREWNRVNINLGFLFELSDSKNAPLVISFSFDTVGFHDDLSETLTVNIAQRFYIKEFL